LDHGRRNGTVTLAGFSPMGGFVLAARAYCHNDYWQVCFDTNMTIRQALGEAGFPVPEPHVAVRGAAV
jgi:hypothetical protein